jgi:hypothetical protein
MPVRFGVIINVGSPREMAELAVAAEAAGWDGVFYYDAIAISDSDLYDPWVVLAAMAMQTDRVKLGLIVTPPARRRPWKLARETMTLDRLSAGRLIVPVGLGTLDDKGFGNVGEPVEARTRAELMDESLEILVGLWSGEPFSFAGRHYRFGPMVMKPTPVQRPRIPIWVVGTWPYERSMRRVVRWDGVVAQVSGSGDLRKVAEYVTRERDPKLHHRPFDITAEGQTPYDDVVAAAEIVRPWADAGATWWLEADWKSATVASLRRRIEAGPPRLYGPAGLPAAR